MVICLGQLASLKITSLSVPLSQQRTVLLSEREVPFLYISFCLSIGLVVNAGQNICHQEA